MNKSPINIDTQNIQDIQRTSWVQMPMPDARFLGRYSLWALGRILIGLVQFSNVVARSMLQGGVWVTLRLDDGINFLLISYNAIPFAGIPLKTLEMKSASPKAQELLAGITPIDLLETIQGKHLLIIGSTGTGKSTIAQHFAQQSASQVRVYDSDATPDEWQGLEVIGRGGDFLAIETAMQCDLLEMEDRIKARATSGDSANAGKDLCIICEEFPLIKDEIASAGEWLGKIARRGRKPKMFIIALSQSDTVTALGIEGDGAIRTNFKYLRLGKHAIDHARKMKNDALTLWLQSGKYRALLDDEPCQLPQVTSSQRLTPHQYIQQFPQPTFTPETPIQQDLQPSSPSPETFPDALKTAVKALKAQGYSDSKIITEVLGYSGRQYATGKALLQKLLDG